MEGVGGRSRGTDVGLSAARHKPAADRVQHSGVGKRRGAGRVLRSCSHEGRPQPSRGCVRTPGAAGTKDGSTDAPAADGWGKEPGEAPGESFWGVRFDVFLGNP